MKKFMYFAAALLVLVGCNKNSQTNKENAPQEIVTIKGGIVLPKTPNKIAPAEGWQTATEPFQMLWEEGDQIYIWNQAAPNNGQIFTLIDGAGTSEGTFSGTKLEDMSEYFVSNVGQIGLGEYTVEYVENNFRHPYISCIGHENSFFINNFGAVIGLQLKGSVTLSKIEVKIDLGGGMITKFTMPFGEDGLTLNNTTATKVYIPVDAPGELETETISFYVGDEVIMSKTLTEEEQLPVQNTVTTYPELGIPTYVDLGLPSGVKWATMNVGATNETEYGDYFAWGEIAPYYTGLLYDGTAQGWKSGKENGYSPESYLLGPGNDAATANWGGDWRMPTKAEWEELMNPENCTWVWQPLGLGNAYMIISRIDGYTDKYIILPAAGHYSGTSLTNSIISGCYWSSSFNDEETAYNLSFDQFCESLNGREFYYGCPVRPVYNVAYK